MNRADTKSPFLSLDKYRLMTHKTLHTTSRSPEVPRLRSVLTRVTDPPRCVLHPTITLLFASKDITCQGHCSHWRRRLNLKKKAHSHFPASGQAVNHRCRPFLLSPVYTCLRFYRAEANRLSFLLLVHFSSTFLIHALALSAAEEDPKKSPVQLQY